MKIAIAGAGIGGLVLALSLHDAGFDDVTCYESVSELKPLGVGINLLPHAIRELTELGLLDDLDRIAVRTADLTYVNAFGQTIWSEPRGLAAGYEWPQFSIHRGYFQMMLAEKVIERLGPQAIQLGQRVLGAETVGNQVTFDTTAGQHTADVLIAADGIKSSIRAQWRPEEGAPIWNGTILWRGTSYAKPFLTERSMIMAGHRSVKFVAYPIGNVREDGKQLINWIAEQYNPDETELENNWNRVVSPDKFRGLFADWNFGWLNIPELIDSAVEVLEYPLADRDPIDQWVRGRVALLGDAAHPTYPIGSNGSSQAIIDARVLAHFLATSTVDEALASYQAERQPKTSALQLANRQMGPEIVMQLVHERAPQGFDRIEDVMTADELAEVAGNYKKVAGFDPAALSARPSWSVQVQR